MTSSVGIRFTILVALTIVSNLALATGQSNEVGSFDIVNTGSARIRARCLGLGDQGYVQNLGDIILTGGSKWAASVSDPATSINCLFSLTGKQDAQLSMWEAKFSPFYDLPVRCSDCHWAVNEIGFSVVNPLDGQYVHVADWTSKSPQPPVQAGERTD